MKNNKFRAVVRQLVGAVTLTFIATLILVPGAWAARNQTLYAFTGGNDGGSPVAAVTFDAAGNLYGTAFNGGANGNGTVFKLTRNSDGSWTESVLHTFCSFTSCGDGAQPGSTLIFDAAGNLYGTARNGGTSTQCAFGCGVVFQLVPNSDGSWTENVLYSFTRGADGGQPDAGLIFDQAGNLYGTASAGGGGCSCGVVFRLSPNGNGGWTETVLHSFTGSDGNFSEAALIFDAAGNLFGTTVDGGTYRGGVVFELSPNSDGSWTETVLHHFTGGKDGGRPMTDWLSTMQESYTAQPIRGAAI